MALLEDNNPITGDGEFEFPNTQNPMTIVAVGNFGGGTLTIEVRDEDGSTWVEIDDSSTIANRVFNFWNALNHVRFKLSGSAGPSIKIETRELIR